MKKKFKQFKNKKDLKNYVNSNGFYCSALIKKEENTPNELKEKVPKDAIYFKAIASSGELNRNGYIIRESAWVPAINDYLSEGGVLLLQHDPDQPIGAILKASVTEKGLEIEGYIFDDLTGHRFSRNLFNAVSTGHLTMEIEFENINTKQVLSEEEFRNLPWEERENENWVMAVTKLDWLENSIVSIGANRKAKVTSRDVMKNYIDGLKENDASDEDEEDEQEPPESEPDNKTEKQENNPIQKTDEKKQIETSVTNAESENDKNAADSETIEVNKSDVVELNATLKNLCSLVESQKNQIKEKDEEILRLNNKLDNIPKRKGIVVANHSVHVANQRKEDSPEKNTGGFLSGLLQSNGIPINK